MNIDGLSLEKLKALAFDEWRRFDIARQNLAVLNDKIRQKEEQDGRDKSNNPE